MNIHISDANFNSQFHKNLMATIYTHQHSLGNTGANSKCGHSQSEVHRVSLVNE